MREFDVATKSFVADGFKLPVAKSAVSWIDGDTLLVGTDFGEGSQTTSGYPRIAKVWTRGQPLADAKTVVEGKVEDTGVWGGVLTNDEAPYRSSAARSTSSIPRTTR